MLFIVSLVYNFVMTGLDVIALICLGSRRNWRTAIGVLGIYLFSMLVLAVLLGGPSFAAIRFLAFGLFIHLPLVLVGIAIIARRSARSLSIIATLSALIVLAAAIDAVWVEPQWLEVTRHRIVSEQVDQPIRIAVVADLQTDQLTGYEKKVFDQLFDAEPDVILFAGDYLQAGSDSWFELAEQYQSFFGGYDWKAPLGAYAVGGNTDHPEWIRIFEKTPVHCSRKTEVIRNDQIQVTGLSMAESFDTTLRVPATNRFHIVLGHSPDFALGEINADLLVAGHTHGGQVQIPFWGPIITLSAVPRAWACGITEIAPGKNLVVSRGIGMERGDAPRLRFWCRPQLMIIDVVPPGHASNSKPVQGPS